MKSMYGLYFLASCCRDLVASIFLHPKTEILRYPKRRCWPASVRLAGVACLLLFIVLPATLEAQSGHIAFDHIGTDQGLSTGTVNCIFRDSRGYVWIGTQDGLNRYDAYEVTVFKHDPKDPSSIAGSRITSIGEDKLGRVWFATRSSGISVFDWKTESFSHLKNVQGDSRSLASNMIYVLYSDSEGRMMVGTSGGLSVYNYESNDFTSFRHDPNNKASLSASSVLALLEEAPGKYWVSCNSGAIDLFDLAAAKSKRIVYDPSYAANSERKRFTKDSRGILWIGTDGQGIYRVNPATGDFDRIVYDPYVQGLNHNIVTFVREMKGGKIWIGTDGGGINVYDPKTEAFSYIRNSLADARSLSSDAVYNIYEDNSGIIWISTFRGGVNYYSPFKSKFAFYKKIEGEEQSLSFSSVISAAKGPNGKVWIGTDGGGLDLFDPRTGTFVHNKYSPFDDNSLSSNVIKSICTDHEGNVWTGTYAAGMTKWDIKNNKYTRFRHDATKPGSLGGNNIWAIHEDAKHRMWFGVLGGGLDLYDRETGAFTHFKHDPDNKSSISSNMVKLIFEDSRNNFWVGTEDQGLCLFNRETRTFERFYPNPDDPKALPNPDIRTLFEDSKGQLFVGTSAGLCLFNRDNKTFTTLPVSKKLASSIINGMQEDRNGNWWISTSFGLSRVDPATGQVINYDKSDGLQGNEFNYTSSVKTAEGYMIFGGTGGFNIFKPEEITQNVYNAPVELTEFSLFGKAIHYQDTLNDRVILSKPLSVVESLELTHKENVFSIEFASLDCTTPSRNKYRYQLVGFDEDWVQAAANERRATYMNLSPGDYEFRVTGTNSDGVWSQSQRSVKISILPPWWSTWWFRIFALVVVVGLLLAVYQWRVKALKYQRLQLKRQVEERTRGLEEMIEIIRSNSGHITEAGKALKVKSGLLAGDATTQDSHAREIEEALSRILSNTKRSAENAEITNAISETTIRQLEQIREATLKNISEIKTISQKIVVLEELFKQTNMLAINASIEASRAGTYGKGFAVIAAEVRSLAERSKEASNEIIRLAQKGERETEQVGSLILDFIPEVQKSAKLIHEISVFSKEQGTAVDNVFDAVKSFFRISKKNTEVSGEIHEISSELDSLAKYLSTKVNAA